MQDFNPLLKSCSELLNSYHEAKDIKYYLSNRISIKAQEQFQFGYFPNSSKINSLLPYLKNKYLEDNGLLINKKHYTVFNTIEENILFFEHHNLILPYKDVYGRVIAIVGRTLLSKEQQQEYNIPKYKNTVFKKSQHLFGLFENKVDIIKKDYCIVVEGQFDLIKCWDCGIGNVVALGSSSMSFDQLALLLRYTNNIKVVLDNDNAGDEGRKRIVNKYGRFARVKNFYIPSGWKDMDEFLCDGGKEEDLMER